MPAACSAAHERSSRDCRREYGFGSEGVVESTGGRMLDTNARRGCTGGAPLVNARNRSSSGCECEHSLLRWGITLCSRELLVVFWGHSHVWMAQTRNQQFPRTERDAPSQPT